MSNNFDKNLARMTFHKLLCVDRLHRSIFEKMHSKLGIHRSQHRLLMYISKMDVCPSQKEIAEHFDISPAAVAVSLKKLEESGFVSRISPENDNRFNCVALTEKGRKLAQKSGEIFDSADIAMFREFSKEDFDNLNNCLDKIAEGLNGFEFDADDFSLN